MISTDTVFFGFANLTLYPMSVNMVWIPLQSPHASIKIVISELGMPSRNRSIAFFEDGKVCSRVMFPSLSMIHPASFSLWISNPA